MSNSPTDPSPVSPDPWREFRHEVVDKLSVASHCGRRGGRTHTEIVLKQCEDFLVEQAQELVDAARAADAALLRERDAQIASLTAQVEQQKADKWHWIGVAMKDAKELFTLRAERDALVKDIEDWKREQAEGDRAYSALEAERDAAQQEIAALRRALGDAFADRVVATLSSSPRPQEPQP